MRAATSHPGLIYIASIVAQLPPAKHLTCDAFKAFQPFSAYLSLRSRSALNHSCFTDAATTGWLL